MKKQILILGVATLALLGGQIDNVNGSMLSVENPVHQSNQAELTLRQNMRKLWADHVIWTRDYIVATVSSAPDAPIAAIRLLKNQEDIGAAIAVYYGKEAGDKLTDLLKQHILIAVDLIDAAKINDQVKFADVNNKWKQNGQEIADFLSQANPNWPQLTMRDMMSMHLATTTGEVTARLGKKYEEDVKAFDEVFQHMLMMADALSDGIVKQFPSQF